MKEPKWIFPLIFLVFIVFFITDDTIIRGNLDDEKRKYRLYVDSVEHVNWFNHFEDSSSHVFDSIIKSKLHP